MARPRLPSGKKQRIVSVYYSLEEYGVVKEYSDRAGLSLSIFVRKASLGARILSREDHQARLQMMQAIAEIKRQGGLLKLAISEGAADKETVAKLLREFDPMVKQLKEAVDKL